MAFNVEGATLVSTDISVNSTKLNLAERDQTIHQTYRDGVSPAVAQLVQTPHFQKKLSQIIPNQVFAPNIAIQLHVDDKGALSVREKGKKEWVQIYSKEELIEPQEDMEKSLTQITQKTREAFDALFSKEPNKVEHPLSSDRVTSAHHSCCSHHAHHSSNMQSRDEAIGGLKEQVKQLRREIAALKNEPTPSPLKVATLDHSLKRTTQSLEDLPSLSPTLLAQNKELSQQKEALKSLRQELHQANQDKAALLLVLTAADQGIKTLQQQLQEKSSDLLETEGALETFTDTYEKLHDDHSALEKTLEERTGQLHKTFALFLGSAGLYKNSQTTVRDLKEQLDVATQDAHKLQSLLESTTEKYEHAIHELSSRAEKAENETSELRDQLDIRDRALAKAEATIKDLTPKLAAATREASRLETLLQSTTEESELAIKELSSLAEEAQREVATLKKQLLSSTQDNEHLKPLLEKATEKASRLERELEKLMRTSKLALEELSSRAEKAESEASGLKKELHLVRKQAVRLDESFKASEKELKENFEAHIKKLETQVLYWKDQVQGLIKKAVEAESLSDELGSSLKIEKERTLRLEAGNKELTAILRDAHRKVESLHPSLLEEMDESCFPGKHIGTKIDQLLSSNEELTHEISTLQEKLLAVEERHSKNLRSLGSSHQEALEKQAELHREEETRLKLHILGGEREIARLVKRVSTLTSKHLRVTQELEAARKSSDVLRKETIERLRAKVSGLETTIQEKDALLFDENSEIVDRNQTIEKLKRDKVKLAREIESLQETIASIDKENDYYYQEAQDSRLRASKIETTLESTSQALDGVKKALAEKERELEKQALEADVFFQSLNNKLEQAQETIMTLEDDLQEKDLRITALERENEALKQLARSQERTIETLTKEAHALSRENKDLWAVIKHLTSLFGTPFSRDDLSGTSQHVLAAAEKSHALVHTSKAQEEERVKKLSLLKEIEQVQRAIPYREPKELKMKSGASSSSSSSKSDPLQLAAHKLNARLGQLLHGLGEAPIPLILPKGTTSDRARLKVFLDNRKIIMNGTTPSKILDSVKPRSSKVIGQAAALARLKNHKGFNALIYQQNTFLDFIDRLQGFMERHEGVIQRRRQDLVQKFFIRLLDTIRLDTAGGENPLTHQYSTGRGFEFFGKDLISMLYAFENLDASFYDGHTLIEACNRAEGFRNLVSTLSISLKALFEQVELR